ncbi:MAG: hypothetical protein ACYSWS_06630 [Planctomycetota bacterium]|jgi:hypothetical protein
MRITKTAGTKFNDFLYNNILPGENRIWITYPLEFSFISYKELNGFDYIATHVGYGFFNRITVEHKKITKLRHLVERLLLMYYSERELHNKHGLLMPKVKLNPLEEFVESTDPVFKADLDNSMTWQFFFMFSIIFFELSTGGPQRLNYLGRHYKT